MKLHPYNQILRVFYKPVKSLFRPKIFGMTASPVWNGKQGMNNLRALEQNTDCIVQRVTKNSEELEAHVSRPVEVFVLHLFLFYGYTKYRHLFFSLQIKIVPIRMHSHHCGTFWKT
jgi:hypothetical protein